MGAGYDYENMRDNFAPFSKYVWTEIAKNRPIILTRRLPTLMMILLLSDNDDDDD